MFTVNDVELYTVLLMALTCRFPVSPPYSIDYRGNSTDRLPRAISVLRRGQPSAFNSRTAPASSSSLHKVKSTYTTLPHRRCSPVHRCAPDSFPTSVVVPRRRMLWNVLFYLMCSRVVDRRSTRYKMRIIAFGRVGAGGGHLRQSLLFKTRFIDILRSCLPHQPFLLGRQGRM